MPYTHVHAHSLYWLGKGTTIKSDGVKLVLRAQTSPLSEMIRPYKCFSHVSEMQTLTYN